MTNSIQETHQCLCKMETQIKNIIEKLSFPYANICGSQRAINVREFVKELSKIGINIEIEEVSKPIKMEKNSKYKCIDCGTGINSLIFGKIPKCNNCYMK